MVVEAGAGEARMLPDAAFTEAGATIASDTAEVWEADVVVKVAPPTAEEIVRLRRARADRLPRAAHRDATRSARSPPPGATAFAMEAIPRISRAQSMDALSSQANVGGYKARAARPREEIGASSRC